MKRMSLDRYFVQMPEIQLSWLDEPELVFGNSQCHVNPKIGINLYGPRSLNTTRHKNEVHIGFVGQPEPIENVRKFLHACNKGVEAEDLANGSLHFPGNSPDQGYRFDIKFADILVEKITDLDAKKWTRVKLHFGGFFELKRAQITQC
ncbi:MAG: hypothetical protein JW725_03470, partial [Candidatus Babeliaceae bacterium]|nr:hypothetical protein [Candidatus Babeliaceae bacterium]